MDINPKQSKENKTQLHKMLKGNIARRLILSIILFSSMLTLIITAYQLSRDYLSGINKIKQSFILIKKSHMNNLAHSLWVENYQQAKIQIEGMLNIPNAEHIKIVLNNKKIIEVRKKTSNYIETASYPISYIYNNKPILLGELHIESSIDELLNTLIDKALTILISNGVKTTLVAIFIFFLVYLTVTRHLEKIAKHARKLSVQSSQTDELPLIPSKQGSQDQNELNMVITALNTMQKALAESFKAIKRSEKNYKALVESANVVPWRLNAHTQLFVYMGPQIKQLTGYKASKFHRMANWLNCLHPEDRKWLPSFVSEKIQARESYDIEYRLLTKDKKLLWVRDVVAIKHNDKTNSLELYGSLFNITDKKQSHEKLEYIAHHDVLTGVYNRNLFIEHLTQCITLARRRNDTFAILFMDLDQFKHFNDTLGHSFGDSVLKTVSNIISNSVRESDTVARFGGDEFLVLLNSVPNKESVTAVANNILSAIKKPININKQEIYLTLSMGICLYPEHGKDPETILKNADRAMYAAKEKGRNNYQYYSKKMSEQAASLVRMKTELNQAIKNHQFQLYYQAQYCLHSGRLIGYEALTRWNHPEKGLLSPLEFIHILEETGMIIEVGNWVLRTACRQAKIWQDRGYPPITVSVNYSVNQFNHNDAIKNIKNAIAYSQLAPQYIELEITESVLMKTSNELTNTMNAIKDMGLKLAIDDFGTGYSSYSSLNTFNISRLKIDQSFIKKILASNKDTSIVSAIISMAHNLNFLVIAEGVETKAQAEKLKQLGCNIGQGYYFSKPLTADEFEKTLLNAMLTSKQS